MFTLDTNAIIYIIKKDENAIYLLHDIMARPEIPLYVSTITETELFSFSQITPDEARKIENFLENISLVPLVSQIARTAGYIRGAYDIKLADSVIAATTLFTGSTLLTRNTKDFKKIPGFKMRAI